MPSDNFLHKLIRVTLRPFIKLLLRYGVGYGEFAQVCKGVFVDVADTEFRLAERKQTVSRISVLTGITRREIKQIREMSSNASVEVFQHNHAARVLNAWMNDLDFQDSKGKPADLTITAEGSGTFNKLTLKYGNNTPYRAILDELVRVGAVAIDEDGKARLVSTGYLPDEDSQDSLNVAMQSVAELIATIDYNDKSKPDNARLQLTVSHDNVSDDGVEVFRQISGEKSKELLLFLDRFLATQDRGSNADVSADGHNRTGLGLFYFENKHNPE